MIRPGKTNGVKSAKKSTLSIHRGNDVSAIHLAAIIHNNAQASLGIHLH